MIPHSYGHIFHNSHIQLTINSLTHQNTKIYIK